MAANRKLLAVAVACAAAVIGVTGCSSDGDKDPFDGMSADKIAKKAADASKGAGSFKVSGEGKKEGKPLKVDFAVAGSGDCTGKTTAVEGTAEFIVTDKSMYMKGDEAYWKSQPGGSQVTELVKGRWVETPKKKGGVCDPDNMFKTDKLKGLERGEDTDIDGKKVAVLTKKKGKETKTFYVALDGKPYFLRVVTRGSQDAGTTDFTDYGKPVDVKAPPAKDVVDMKKLANGG